MFRSRCPYRINSITRRSHSLGGNSSSPSDCSDLSIAEEVDLSRYFRHQRHASAERIIDEFITNGIFIQTMNSNGNSYFNSTSTSSALPLSCSSHSLHSSASRMNTLNANHHKDLLSPGNEVLVTRTVSPSFYSHGLGARDLVFRKDEQVRIVGATTDPLWYRAKNSNHEEGLVHADFVAKMIKNGGSSYLDNNSGSVRLRGCENGPMSTTSSTSSSHHSTATHNQPWYHSMITREKTEKLLNNKPDGTFLVRESTNFPGDFTLSMSYRGKVEHYRIYQTSGGQLTCDNEEYFSNLTQLVSHYKRDADGLCHRLVTPIISDSCQFPSNGSSSFGSSSSAVDLEDRTSVFRNAGLVISRNEIILGDTIGHGEFGDVLLGEYRNRKVAVKVSKRHGNGMLDSLLDEAKFMVGVSHRNLVTLVGVVLDDVNVYMITEYMANGNLVDLLRSRGRHSLEKHQLLKFAIDICQGMCYLESRQIVHRDLAARNVLLDEDLTAKVSDFGLAKKANSVSNDSSSGKFPIKWTAPEALRQSQFSTKSDIWSFGILLWEIFSFGRVPYPRIPIQDVVRHIERGYRMESPDGCPPEVFKVMNETWALQPSDRPSFTQVLQRLSTIIRTRCCVEMSNFTSFVDLDGGSVPKVAAVHDENGQLSSKNASNVLFEHCIDYLPDEIISFYGYGVSFSMQFGESEQGTIACTKARLRFTPLVRKQRDLPRRSKVFDDFYDIPLCSIAKIMIAPFKSNNRSKPEKFQKMEYNYSSMEVISMIRLILKDFRVVTIDLHRSQHGTHLANQILVFSKSFLIGKMIQVGGVLKDKGSGQKIPFNTYESWENELKRCGISTDSSSNWRICAVHKEGLSYSSEGYPMYFVVPNYLSENDINRLMQNWKKGRLPIWVWGKTGSSASLMISAEHENNIATPEILAKLNESIGRCHDKAEKPYAIHLDSNFVTDVGRAYDNLIKLCAIDSYEQYVQAESNWVLKLNRTGWLHLIRSCLSATYEAIKWIIDWQRTVILYENDNRDMSLIVASLVQICCDPFYRTTSGFRQLLDKMWISLGHPFGQRLLGRDEEDDRKNGGKTLVFPTFLVFLDCVAQLHRLHPYEFSFSQHLLIALWDLSLTGLVPSFSCNNVEEQLTCKVSGGPFPLEAYFDNQYINLFGNIHNDVLVFIDSVKKKQPIGLNSVGYLQVEIIRPPTTILDVQIWKECYLRWILPANLQNSGELEEMHQIDKKMLEISRRLQNREWKQHFDLPESYSSAYPYSLPEISRPIIEINDSLNDISDFEMIRRPSDLDGISVASSFMSMSFTQTPIHSRNNHSHDLTPSSGVRMQPKQQTVSFSKANAASEDDFETPILTKQSPLPSTSIPSTSSQSSSSNPRGNRPIPPPRPAGLSSSTKSPESPDEDVVTTRF
ncbi:unnamed protein product [Caenorhabditis angaria]|uniref:non-specific protein-tyrosine kinase n=1 Tax=Caenorhabditis angaria TaxID=860376 RepID=A0A9P1I3M2_9PELO|nr:unnamed protein product [Caenorhabditis angaria]